MSNGKPLNSSIKISTKSSPNDAERHLDCSVNSVNDEISDIRNILTSILKIIVLVSLSDEETSDDFFSTYENYRNLALSLSKRKLNVSEVADEDAFCSNPIGKWIEVLMVTIISLHAFPGNSNITCDIIGNGNGEPPFGVCYSTALVIESLDWTQHSVELFIPTSDKEGGNVLFLVDDEIRLFSKL